MAFHKGVMLSRRVVESGKYLLGHISTSCGSWSKQITSATRVRDLISNGQAIVGMILPFDCLSRMPMIILANSLLKHC